MGNEVFDVEAEKRVAFLVVKWGEDVGATKILVKHVQSLFGESSPKAHAEYFIEDVVVVDSFSGVWNGGKIHNVEGVALNILFKFRQCVEMNDLVSHLLEGSYQ